MTTRNRWLLSIPLTVGGLVAIVVCRVRLDRWQMAETRFWHLVTIFLGVVLAGLVIDWCFGRGEVSSRSRFEVIFHDPHKDE